MPSRNLDLEHLNNSIIDRVGDRLERGGFGRAEDGFKILVKARFGQWFSWVVTRELLAAARAKIEQGMSHSPSAQPNGDDSPLKLLLASFFSEEEAAIVRALGGGEMSAETLAQRVGRSSPDNGLRKLLSNLVKRGILETLHTGYRLANKKFLDFLPPL